MRNTGYTFCACRDCFDITISSDMNRPEMCHDCEEAGCEGNAECCRDDAYGEEYASQKAGDGLSLPLSLKGDSGAEN